ncbi:uncharacterized protein L969DRAFT_93173 [Mixia osmundae IAM 14324]|uniref:MT-A70-domain-containing protein n=1 Tax=Mixia osmundae (strain CBS 9802 / IAM 14324 / JCM 22182 / KY 12970) TaxID=764103 RepID=G7E5V9_MIXOS|nr:uncharacterized protein L969DRAFT_93173 [Mixia osmundae IAM 14324]KEI40629.1 hypothetical protein L969DRAFT_93173 [Mixia osmundae IAM 14324]GAA98219.1 hypothetical protein E5Q_04902 [Mixia osmundae IAM 14324]
MRLSDCWTGCQSSLSLLEIVVKRVSPRPRDSTTQLDQNEPMSIICRSTVQPFPSGASHSEPEATVRAEVTVLDSAKSYLDHFRATALRTAFVPQPDGQSVLQLCCPTPAEAPFTSTSSDKPAQRRPKRAKRSDEPHKSKADANAYHATISQLLHTAIASARSALSARAWYDADAICPPNPTIGADWAALVKDAPAAVPRKARSLDDVTGRIEALELINRVCKTDTGKVVHLDRQDTPILVPPCSAFLIADMKSWDLLLPPSHVVSDGYDLVILDPPWPNKSASRAKQYDQIDIYDLLDISLPTVLEGANTTRPCLVCVWLTNKPRYRRFVTDTLFPHWGISSGKTSEGHWIKTSTQGEPLFSLDDQDRRCYESFIMAWWIPSEYEGPAPVLPDPQVFLSVPIGHSRKPVIIDLLRHAFQRTPNVLELFARTTLSGRTFVESRMARWVSVGNEALKFNSASSFELA